MQRQLLSIDEIKPMLLAIPPRRVTLQRVSAVPPSAATLTDVSLVFDQTRPSLLAIAVSDIAVSDGTDATQIFAWDDSWVACGEQYQQGTVALALTVCTPAGKLSWPRLSASDT
jgi:hypothetical protein